MLGSIIHSRSWYWAVVGKHPAAADYIKLAGGSALLDAVGQWMVKGYDALHQSRGHSKGPYSWRFWLQGAKKDTLICGLIRDSSDRIGRPFPLLIMGEGPLRGWEKQWPLLPVQLSKIWTRMEFIAAHAYADVKALGAELRSLASPDSASKDWESSAAQSPLPCDDEHAMAACRTQLDTDGRAVIRLCDDVDMDFSQAAVQWHLRLKARCAAIPRSVFLGGTPQQAYMVVLRHPLGTDDFLQLWRVENHFNPLSDTGKEKDI